MRQSACLVVNPITVDNFASLFNCTPVGRASDTVMDPTNKATYFSRLGPELFVSVAWPTWVQLLIFFCSSVPVVLFDNPGIARCRSQHVVSVESKQARRILNRFCFGLRLLQAPNLQAEYQQL